MGMAVGPAGGKKKGIPPGINITPLVDIVLVLLIIFMVMTPLMMKHFSFNLPEKEEQDSKPQAAGASNLPTALVLTINDDTTMTLNGTKMADIPALITKLQQAFAARQDNSMFFDAGDKVHYGQIAETLDACREAGAKAIALVTDRSKLAQLQ